MFKIGKVEIDHYPLILAPMEDVTDVSFRYICKQYGADLMYTEFIASEALIRNIEKTVKKMHLEDHERPVGIQIYGHDPGHMVEAARMAAEMRPDIIDINCGCPVKKIATRGDGAGLLQDPGLMCEIARRVVDAVPDIPVTVKTRLGWDEDSKIIVPLAERLQDTGIQALAIHGRTRMQFYKGEADWTLIGEVKNNPRIHIPIIGNGDIKTPEQAREAFNRYGVDAVMVGRATFGCPWIFKEMKEYIFRMENTCIKDGAEQQSSSLSSLPSPLSTFSPLTLDDKIDILEEQLRINVERIDEYRGILHTRRHLASSPIFKGIPDFRQTRIAMLRAETVADLTAILEECRVRLKPDKQ